MKKYLAGLCLVAALAVGWNSSAPAATCNGADPGEVIDQAQKANSSFDQPRGPLVKLSLLRNLKICDGLGMLDAQNRELLRRGEAPIIRRGPYAGQRAEVDHIVPLALAWELGNELATLELLPEKLNRAKGAKIGERQLAVARRFYAAGMLNEDTMRNIERRFVPSGTEKYELPIDQPATISFSRGATESLRRKFLILASISPRFFNSHSQMTSTRHPSEHKDLRFLASRA